MGEATRGESLLLQDLNEFVRQTSDLLEDEPQTTGIRPNPVIEVTETTLDTVRFGFNFGDPPAAETSSGGGFSETFPDTGACCFENGDCFILSEDECETDGGTYQGNDTECVPNPCSTTPPPSCCEGIFQAFDGSCRYFLTKTSVASLTGSVTAPKCGGTAHGVGSVDTIDIETFDPDTCEHDCAASGSLVWDVTVSGNGAPPAGEVHCYGTRSVCGETSGHETTYFCDGTVNIDHDYTDFDTFFGGYPFNHCVFTSGSSTSETATVRTTTFTGDFTGTFTETLSDEVSITGACCDYDSLTCSITTQCDCVCDACSWIGTCSTCDECGF